jgi:hypothetical protein
MNVATHREDIAMNQTGLTLKAKAHPAKAFFINMQTRDITLSDCILDLVDNAIHSLIKYTGLDVSQHLFAGTNARRIDSHIDITYGSGRFRIKDNCGGISIEDAKEQVFLLGNPVKDKQQTGLGVYGIGMKRAFFKIGRQISVTSNTTEEKFKIDINVDEWEKSAEWDFPFTYAEKKKSTTGGTDIEVVGLNPSVGEQFVSTSFKMTLVEKISRAYALFLKAGLSITVNGVHTISDIPELVESKDLRAVRHMVKEDGVDILIMAGLSPLTDRKPRGWYVFCNGRMVLDADKTERTGWGIDSHPVFHAKYNHFLGYVYFRSRDVQKLPWTTTKEGVDMELPIYQKALVEMRLVSRPVLDFLGDLYSDVKEQSEPEHNLFKEAKPVQLIEIASRANVTFKARIKRESEDSLVSIQYKRPKRMLRKIREVLGKSSMSAYRIGEYTFDWFYDRNCK